VEKQLVINFDKCTGCRMCEMACSLKKERECNPRLSRIRIVKMTEGRDIPQVCLQCELAACESVCPVGAITRDSNGALVINHDLCVECEVCLVQCPLGAVYVNPETRRIIKCDLCDGDPACVRFCQAQALEYVGKNQDTTVKKVIAAKKILKSVKDREKSASRRPQI